MHTRALGRIVQPHESNALLNGVVSEAWHMLALSGFIDDLSAARLLELPVPLHTDTPLGRGMAAWHPWTGSNANQRSAGKNT